MRQLRASESEILKQLPQPEPPAAPPAPPVLNAPKPAAPVAPPVEVWFGGKNDLLQLRFTSGASIQVREVLLFNEADLQKLNAMKAQAMQLLGGVSSPVGAWGSVGWVLAATAFIGLAETLATNAAAKSGIGVLQQAVEFEKALQKSGGFFPVGRIQHIAHPLPGNWRACASIGAIGYVHDGSDFISVKDIDGNVSAIRWSAVEHYAHQSGNT